MLRKINYGDNIYFLAMTVRTLRNSLNLDIDNDLFQEKLVGDIEFLHLAIEKIYSLLKESSLIIGKIENLKSIQRLKRQFSNLLTNIINGKYRHSIMLAYNFEHYRSIKEIFLNNIEEIKTEVTGLNDKNYENKYIISDEEYKCLFSEEE